MEKRAIVAPADTRLAAEAAGETVSGVFKKDARELEKAADAVNREPENGDSHDELH
jgi:F420-dependent methylenetetrahydromethanopterin dehydrogenase